MVARWQHQTYYKMAILTCNIMLFLLIQYNLFVNRVYADTLGSRVISHNVLRNNNYASTVEGVYERQHNGTNIRIMSCNYYIL